MKEEKERLDVLLVNRGMVESREKAKAIIMTGNVFVNEQREDKAGQKFPVDVYIEIRGKKLKFVSRGGYKLEKALQVFPIDLTDLTCMDVGASTGGFTDCMLQNGAKFVYSIDVGTNQLAWKLRQDERVRSMEKTNIRYVTAEDVGELVDFVSIDVAFISLTKVLEPIWHLMKNEARMVCLIKPQFEAGRRALGKSGVVRDRGAHRQVLRELWDFWHEQGCRVLALTHSPITGGDGNIEYLAVLSRSAQETVPEQTLRAIVDAAFDAIKNNKR